MQKTAMYPGSFDPITFGHLDVIKRALKIFDKLIVAVGENTKKKHMFTAEERAEMVREATNGLPVEVEVFSGLIVDYAKSKKCSLIIRSLRAMSDFESEFQMAVMNRKLDEHIETVFLMTDKEFFYLNSSIVKEIAHHKGKVGCLVPKCVEEKIKEKLK